MFYVGLMINTRQKLVPIIWNNKIKKSGGPSRWRKSKTWSSPSSPLIHQKYIYMWNTPTEHLLNAGRRPQSSQKGRNSPCTRVGQKKKKRQKNRDSTCTTGRELWRGNASTLGSPLTGGDWGGGGEASEPQRRAQQQGCRGQSREIHAQRISADQHSPAWEACLLTCRLGLLGVGTWGSGFFGGQIPGRGLELAAWTQPEGG